MLTIFVNYYTILLITNLYHSLRKVLGLEFNTRNDMPQAFKNRVMAKIRLSKSKLKEFLGLSQHNKLKL